MPRVTVVMAVYNTAQFLRESVGSVLAQTYRDFELIAVDDASTDDSLAVLRSFGDPRLRIIERQTNAGAAESRNAALAEACGDLIAVMDADDICAPTRLERQVAFLDANPRVGLVGCGIFDNIDTKGAVLYTSYLPEDNEAIQQTLMERWCFLHPSVMFRKVFYERVGGYRKELEPAEDHDLILRIIEHCEAHNLYEPLVSYRLNPRGLSVTGHRYINDLGAAAMELARRRRAGKPEGLDAERGRLAELKSRSKAPRGIPGVLQNWRNSLYAANRYYGFGCRELCAGQLDRARRCYLRSLSTNLLFLKSWFGLGLSWMPFAASRLKFVFRLSLQEYNDRNRVGNASIGPRPALSAIVDRTSGQ